MSEAVTTTENPRWNAALSVYGQGMRVWQYVNFISSAKRFAFKHKFGVSEYGGLSKYYSEPQLYVHNHDLFTMACHWYAWELNQSGGN